MARVIISSGHTSDNPGVVSYGLREYDLARKIAKFALKYIRQAGIISLSTPPNLDLANRIDWINKTGYNAGSNDISIEIHINDGGKRGIEGWFSQDGNNPSQKLTEQIVNSICQDLNLPSQGIHSEFQHEMGSISFIHEVTPIACVVECCYIDNAEDAALLADDYSLEKIGRSIARGVISYFGLDIALPEVVQVQTPRNIQQTNFSQPAPTYQQPNGGFQQTNAGNQQPQNYQQQNFSQQNFQQQSPAYQQPISNYQQPNSAYQQPVSSYQPTTYPQQSVMQQPVGQQQQQFQQPQQQQYQNQTYANAQRPITPNQQLQNFQNYQNQASAVVAPTTPTMTSSQTTFPTSPKPSQPATSANSGFLPREERKEMIIKNYAKILGRDPSESDLNYFLNTGIREEELLKKMVDSQEHADLVKARQEVITAKMKMSEEQNELMALRTKTNESDTIIKNLTDSITQKNDAISELNKRIKELESPKNSTNSSSGSASSEKKSSSPQKKKYKGNLSDRVFKAFSDILE
jgi:hypothetical protein